MKIAFIGGGNMGEAIMAAVLEKKLVDAPGVSVSDISQPRLDYLKERYGVTVTNDNREVARGKDIVVLAVKPQNLPEILTELKGSLEKDSLVLSIMAGIRINTIRRGLVHDRIVRSMPNTPAQIGLGITGWTATPEVADEQKEQARSILSVMGKEIYFSEEESLDMVTAVSASGPAYVFLFAECLVDAAVNIGLSREEAEGLVFQTMLGSAHLMQQSGKPPSELRRNVTSKGGTTERALLVFEDGKLHKIVGEAVEAAYKRAQELGS
jgi:pyrroline-5-carboxylate reductase